MKTIVGLALFFISTIAYSQDYTIVQINAKWNKKHDVELPKRIDGYKVVFGYLEDQPKSIQSSIKSVPVVILYEGNRAVKQWNADLSFKLKLTVAEIKDEIYKQTH